MNWLRSGDRNTRFFHTSTIKRRARNKVVRLKGRDDRWLEKDEEINEAFAGFYKELFALEGRRDMERALQFVERNVFDADNDELEREVTVEEIKRAAFQLNGSKAPGLDGYSGIFFIMQPGRRYEMKWRNW